MKLSLLSLGILIYNIKATSIRLSINSPIGVILKTAYNYYTLADFEPYI